jgi:pimeloyl-ACP methyl ester carboxylesterase
MSNPRMKGSRLFAGLISILVLVTSGCGESSDAPRTGYLALGEDKLYYEVSGQGFPLVLVSGGSGMDLRQWDLIAPTLAKSYRVIRYDPRGIGKSDNPTVRYSDAADLNSLVDHLELDQVGLIGLSSAGGFVLEYAIQYPQRITGLVAAAPFVPGFEFSDTMMARLDLFNQAAEKGRESYLDKMLADSHFIPAPLERSVRVSARENMGYNFDKGAGFDPGLPIPLSPPLIEQLTDIRSPVLLLAGELDHPEVLRRNKYLLEHIRLAEETIIPHAGHNGPLENPDAFLDAMNSFLHNITRQ